jgi:hypothetical protein
MPGVHNFIQPTGNSRLPFSMLGGPAADDGVAQKESYFAIF